MPELLMTENRSFCEFVIFHCASLTSKHLRIVKIDGYCYSLTILLSIFVQSVYTLLKEVMLL